ncbi:unnamed protein product, partial [Candidula unifasciata]
MIVYMGIQCYWLLERYYSYPMEVKLDLKASRVLDFPSVTICNLNPIRLDSVKQDPYRPLETFASPNLFDMLYQATVDNWNHPGQCQKDQIMCHGGRCLHASSRCNGKADCPNGDDEIDCDSDSHNSSPSATSPGTSSNTSPTSQEETSTSSLSPSTTAKSRIKREAISRCLMDEVDDIFSKVSLHRSKRQGRPAVDYPTSRSDLNVNMEDIVQNSTFNKWAILSKLSPQSRFYEERDDEYDAAMTYAYITSKLNKSVVEMSGHRKENFIASCDYAGYQCSPDNFTYFHNPKFGNCYIFNWQSPNNTTLETRFPGPEHGLRLELFLDQRNYVANLATEAGVRVLIHKKGSMPFPEDEGVSVMPGRSTSIGMKQVSYTRLPPPHGVCGDREKTTDYYNTCYNTEYSKLIQFCNCAVPFYYVTEDMNVCNMTDINI